MTATSNIALKVPFKEKDEAKSLGARWNPEGKHWYVPEGVDAAPFEKWMDGDAPTTSVAASAKALQLNHATQSTLPINADMDDINAMLRDAYEPNDYEPM
jgi:pantothenate kinase-related protein Tda10